MGNLLPKQGFRVRPLSETLKIRVNNEVSGSLSDFRTRIQRGDLSWEPAQCRINGVRAVHEDKKKAFVNTDRIDVRSNPKIEEIIGFDTYRIEGFNVDVLKYTEGCFASKHIDSAGKYTCLIYLAGFQSEGGDLVLYQNNQEIDRFCPSTIQEDTMVFFPAHMEHEVLPVTKGERYVIKLALSPYHEPPPRRFSCQMD